MAKRASLSAAEVVAFRLYSGPMYLKYHAVLGGMAGATAGGTSYCNTRNTIHLISSGLRTLSRVSEPPAGMVRYRGNGGMALPSGFLEPDEQVCLFVRQRVCACVHACVRWCVKGPDNRWCQLSTRAAPAEQSCRRPPAATWLLVSLA